MRLRGKFVHADGQYYYGFSKPGVGYLGLIGFLLGEVLHRMMEGDTVTFWLERESDEGVPAVRPSIFKA